MRVITRLLPLLFEDSQDGFAEKVFWTVDAPAAGQEANAPQALGARLVKLLIALMFLPGFTVADPQLPPPTPQQAYPPGFAWCAGVGTAAVLPTHGYMDLYRTELLRCLLTCLCGTLYRGPQQEDSAVTARFLDTATSMLQQSQVLFLSLLNACTSYDPVGWGIPYNYIMTRDYKEPLAVLSVQTLVVLLSHNAQQAPAAAPAPATAAATAAVAAASAAAAPAKPRNVLLGYFRELQKPEDLKRITDALVAILTNPIAAYNTYLPGAKKQVAFHQEMLMLLWRLLLDNKLYAAYLLKPGDGTQPALTLVRAVLHYLHEGRKDPAQLGLVHLGTFVLLFLSGERDFSVALNTALPSRSSMGLPAFTGTHADELILVVYRLLTDSQRRLDSLHECLLTILANISPYVKCVAGPCCMNLLKLFELLARPAFVFANERNHRYLFFLLETFNNLIQYQYAGNSRLVYAIIRNREAFNALANLQLPAVKPLPAAADAPAATAAPAAAPPGAATVVPPSLPAPSSSAVAVAAVDSASELTGKPRREGAFVPTAAWLQAWKAQLPIATILRLLAAIIPQISTLIEGR